MRSSRSRTLATAAGESVRVPVFVRAAASAPETAVVTLRAASESDPTKTATVTWTVTKPAS